MAVIGYIFAALSAVFNGSFTVFSKIERVERVNLDPIIFNWYVCLGVFLSSWLVCPALPAIGAPFAFSAYSFFAGTIFVFAVLFSFLAIPLVGIAIGQGVWGSSALLVSFLWGAIPGSKVYSPIVDAGATAAAVALLLCGALGIVYCKDIAVRMCGVGGEPCQTDQGHVLLKDHDEENPMATQQPGEEQSGSAAKRLLGIGSALLVGVFGGAILVPTKYDPDALNYQGVKQIAIMPAFGVGTLVAGSLVTGAYLLLRKVRGQEIPAFHPQATMLAGVMSGTAWNIGNLCSILAQSVPADDPLSYGVAYPMFQCALFFSGLWGVFWFKEIRSTSAISIFFLSGVTLLGGAVILGLYGPGGQYGKGGANTTAQNVTNGTNGSGNFTGIW